MATRSPERQAPRPRPTDGEPAPGLARICLAPGTIGGGGIGVVMLNLAEAFLERGHAVDLLLLDEPADRALPPGLRAVPVGGRARAALPGVLRYLRAARPGLIVSARDYVNLLMLAGHRLARLGRGSRLVWSYHTHGSAQRAASRRADRIAGLFSDRLAGRPDARVAVSAGVARDLERRLGLAAGAVAVIANPVWTPARLRRRHDPCPHPWLAGRRPGERAPDAPVLIGIGRLAPQKDFATLISAFGRLRARRPGARLVVLGEGPERSALSAQAAALGLGAAVDLPGHVADPLPFLSRADLFVLSSRWEGFPLALVEALGCGCPVVAADCPSGPSEILEGGRLAPLVAPGDAAALAGAMAATLDAPGDPGPRVAAALRFGADRAAGRYLELMGPRG